MKILLLCRSLNVGGTERQLVILANGLHQQGHEISVALFYANGPLVKELHASGIRVLDLRKSGRWDIFPFLVRLMSAVCAEKPRVIYGFLGTPNILTIFLKPFFPKINLVWGVRASNVDLDHYGWLSRVSYRFECILSRFADLIICNSNAGLDYAAAHGFPRRKMTVIPNGTDIVRFKPDLSARERIRKEWGIKDHEILIGLVARLDPIKDHSTFLRAAALLSKENPDVRFVCVGDGSASYKEDLYNLAKNLELNEHLIWADLRHDMPAVYNAFDITTSSSTSEGFSNTIAEAMACGVPSVVTDVGDSAIIVGDSGIVVPPSNPEALCAGFIKMIQRLGKDIQGRARSLIVERFSNELLVIDTVKALSRLKILLFARSLGVGGTERQLVILAKGLKNNGHDVSVALFYTDGPLVKELNDSGIVVLDLHKSGRWDILPFFVRIISVIWKLKPMVIYGFLGTPNILTIFLKPLFPRIRMVWGVRASNVDLRHYGWLTRVSYRIECWLSRYADLIICNSHAGLEYAADHGFPREKMTVIPNGIDTERFQPDPVARIRIRKEWGLADNQVLIGLVARLDPMKDHPNFLRAAALLARELTNVHFICAGDGPEDYKKELHKLATDLGLDGRLIWAGTRLDMPAVFSSLDIATSSSSYGEGFSNTVAEAMACGLPSVVTDVGDSALIVGSSGIIVPPSSPRALCTGFHQMLQKLNSEVKLEARSSIERRFASKLLATVTENIIFQMK